ncbi:MarR family winged helix-turn-helix transcriptional regulator [Dinghuibacter silviterrae]|uniref:DNA-binding MarR family transcriptional regulator n=1 Tax=Dinghuibacter silviterrae TaxID=1539049 RepID=A0A4R8DTT2_9BACT|nr:MarR family transcriptional regulator [Dinghuibacter silviterrae]TDX01742.1 DNA-binding MarR family transcriptional regulator [Dinghuibacter silviterrae]
MPLSDVDLAAGLRSQVSRLVKLLRKQTRNDDLLSLTERATLSRIHEHGDILPGELATIEKVSTQAISQVLNRLLELGLINRTPSEEDRRKVIVTLTETGKRGVRQRLQEKQEWLARSITEKLTAREKQTLTEAIDILNKLIG